MKAYGDFAYRGESNRPLQGAVQGNGALAPICFQLAV